MKSRRDWLLISILLLLFLSSLPGRAAGREKLDVALLLDNSGSMHREHNSPGNDERFMRVTAVQYLLEKMAPGDRAALVTFDTDVHTDPQASRLRDIAEPGMKAAFYRGVKAIASVPNGSTNMAAGLRAAAAILQRNRRAGSKRFLIFLTDGTPNPPHGDNTPERIVRYAQSLGQEGISVHTVGLGDLSDNPAEAAAARKLLDDIAREGKGASHQAHHAEDLPALFGEIFAQLVGHEVTWTVPAGQQAAVTLAPGTANLRVLATNDGSAPQITLTDPQGKTYPARSVPPLLSPDQTAYIAVTSVNSPTPGKWTVQSTRGMLEVAWEPGFEAALLAPHSNVLVLAHAPLHIVAQARRKGSETPLKLAQGRMLAEYELKAGQPPISVPLTPSAGSDSSLAQFEGDLPDSGDIGPHQLVVRCFQTGANGEEEGGPAYGIVQAADIPVLQVMTPNSDAAYVVSTAIPVQARLQQAGKSLSRLPSGMDVAAMFEGPAVSASVHRAPIGYGIPLEQDGAGMLAARIPAGDRPGAATVRVTLEGSYNGTPVEPQAVTVPITLQTYPLVEVSGWHVLHPHPIAPDDAWKCLVSVRSSAPAPEQVRLLLHNLPDARLEPAVLDIAANQPMHPVPVTIYWHHARPGFYTFSIEPRAKQGTEGEKGRRGEGEQSTIGVKFSLSGLNSSVRVLTWLQRNRWWLFPLIALLVLLAIATSALGAWWTREMARRQRKMRDLLNGVAVYIPRNAAPFKPPAQSVLARRWFTFGGKGSDVLITDPTQPGQPLFDGPRMRVGVDWDRKARRPFLNVTREGAETMFYDRDNNLLGDAIKPTEGGSLFYVDPEHVLVSVNSEWTT